MKKILFIFIAILISIMANAATYYIAPTGDDATGTGTIDAPWFTLNKAWTSVGAGDTIYLRGGTYAYTTQQEFTDKNGQDGNYIVVINYLSEKPVFDFSGATVSGDFEGLSIKNVDYIHLKGFRIRKIAQVATGLNISKGISIGEASNPAKVVNHAILENIECDSIGGSGFNVEGNQASTYLTFLNCDSHHNADPYSVAPVGTAYGQADGFTAGNRHADAVGYLWENCRAWWNSDDGWDLRNGNPYMELKGCWAFRNGYRPGTFDIGGNGCGFKTGGSYLNPTSAYLRKLSNCVAFHNTSTGFDSQPDDEYSYFSSIYYNCVAWANGNGGINCYHYTDEDITRNCIAYENTSFNYTGNATANSDFNSWNGDVTLTDDDFVTLDTAGVSGVRVNGEIPTLTFLHLVAGSDLIDAGTDVGISYSGVAPDMGAFEYNLPIATTGLGWEDVLSHRNFKGSVNFEQGFSVEGTPIIFVNGLPINIPGLTASASELNILDGATLSTTELNYVDGVTSAIQGQIDSKADTSLSNLGGAGIAVISGIVHDSLTAVLNNAEDGIAVTDTVNGSSGLDLVYSKYQIDTTFAGFDGGLSAGDVAAQINDSIVARLSVAVPGIRVADTASMLSPYALLSEVSGGGITASDTANMLVPYMHVHDTASMLTPYINHNDTTAMLAPYFTEPEIRKADSDTIPIFVFGAGSGGLESDTALFTATNIYGAFYNDKDTIIATSLRAVLIAGTTPLGTDTLAIQVFWNDTINAVFAPTARLNTNYLPVTSTTLGTEDTSFNTSIIPPGVWVFCKSTAGTTGRKPKALYVTLYGFKRNRTY